jgi:hypothetical protein
MSNREFENYLALVCRLLRLNRSQRELIRMELADHLETRVEELVESGVGKFEAVRIALEEFGDAASLAHRLQQVSNLNFRRWMMRFATFSIVITFVASILLMAMWPQEARFGALDHAVALENLPTGNDPNAQDSDQGAESQPGESFLDLNEALNQTVTWEFDETPLIEVMEELRDKYGIQALLDRSAQDSGLTEDTPITFNIRQVPLSQALKLILQPQDATTVADGEILRIISRDAAHEARFFRRQIFDCRKLLDLIRDAESHRLDHPISLRIIPPDANKIGVGTGGTILRFAREDAFDIHGNFGADRFTTRAALQQPTDRATEEPQGDKSSLQTGEPNQFPMIIAVEMQTAESMLIDLVKTTVQTDSWDTTNGEGTLVIVGGCMVVNQDVATIDEIDSLLSELTEKMESGH